MSWVPELSFCGYGITALVIKGDGESRNSAYWPMFQMFALIQLYFALFAFSGRTSKFHLWGFSNTEPEKGYKATGLTYKCGNHFDHNPLLSTQCY